MLRGQSFDLVVLVLLKLQVAALQIGQRLRSFPAISEAITGEELN